MTEALLEKALQLHLSGNTKEAKILYERSIAQGSRDPAAYGNLGFILKEEGNLDKALQATLIALKIAPNNPLFLTNAAGICVERQDYKLAISFCCKALEVEPKNPTTLANLGAAHNGLGDHQKALEATLKSIELQPNNQSTLITAVSIYLKANNPTAAYAQITKALSIGPINAKAYISLGNIQQAMGQLNEAKTSYRKALKLNSKETEALFALANNIANHKEALELIQIANDIQHKNINIPASIFWHYAQANCNHKLKKYSLSEKHLKEAHKLKSLIAPSEAESLIKNIEFFLHRKEQPVKNHHSKCIRIFVVGMPRSGSTLLESILSTNSDISDLGEVDAMGQAIAQWMGPAKPTMSLERLYQEFLGEKDNQKKYMVDKMLYNFRFSGLIAANIPNSRIIHCRRHPLDNILSMLRSHLTRGNNYSTNPEDCAMILIAQEKAMKTYKQRHQEQIKTFNYDAFVSNPQQELQPILEWLHLDWNDAYLHPEKNTRSICTASVVQARQPINKKSLNSWKNYKTLLEPARCLLKSSELFSDYEL